MWYVCQEAYTDVAETCTPGREVYTEMGDNRDRDPNHGNIKFIPPPSPPKP